MVQLLDMMREELAGYLKEMGLPAFRAGQVYELTHSDELVTSVLPIGDGITVSVKK